MQVIIEDMGEEQKTPYKTLGDHLRNIRQKRHESMAEVSGAVEIDEHILQRIEQGRERPTEDILLLLINHFDMPDEEADGLWVLAGYDKQPDHNHDEPTSPNIPNNSRTMVMIMAVDPRVVYADGVQVVTGPSGVIMNFAQGMGTQQALITSRVGMSREQAEATLFALQQALHPPAPKQLPPAQSTHMPNAHPPRAAQSPKNKTNNKS